MIGLENDSKYCSSCNCIVFVYALVGLERSDFEPLSHPDVFEQIQREILRKQNDTERILDEMQQCWYSVSYDVKVAR